MVAPVAQDVLDIRRKLDLRRVAVEQGDVVAKLSQQPDHRGTDEACATDHQYAHSTRSFLCGSLCHAPSYRSCKLRPCPNVCGVAWRTALSLDADGSSGYSQV